MHNPDLSIRISTLGDRAEIQKLFVETVSAICKDDYSPEHIRAWTSSVENTDRWTEKINSQYFLVAELNQIIVGFASLEDTDCVDLLYVHKDYQRQGIADVLYKAIEREASRRGARILYSNVSKTARPFFEKKGFAVQVEQINLRQGIESVNYRMDKQLVTND